MPCQKLIPVVLCQGPGTPTACAFCRQLPAPAPSAAAELAAKIPRTFSLDHEGVVRQKLAGGVYDGEWDVTFALELTTADPHLLVVAVSIYVQGNGVNDDDRTKWRSAIQSAWSNKYKLVNPANTQQYWKVVFDVRWRGEAWPASRRYPVTCVPAAAAVFPADMSEADKKLAQTMLPGAKAQKDKVGGHSITSVHMGEWGKGDVQGVLHEFGHMIGCPDEYMLESCSGAHTMAHSASYNVPGWTTDSIMNNPVSTSKIYPRHFTYVRRVFELWTLPPQKAAYARDALEAVAL